ncbi:MAG: ATP-binding cassette domain-containing protein [Gemmatimonadaceae bacterium]|nr:ATP-binding cassette domain-containing protein [Gemmatimonadaceae bacterium]
MTREAALVLSGIRHRFGRTLALDDASIAVRRGTVHALLGENGAGKSTLMRIAFGMLRPEHGTIHLDGDAVAFASSAEAIAQGIGMVHQHFSLVSTMRAVENVALGARGRLDLAATAARMTAVAHATGLTIDPAAMSGDLSVSAQQRLEIVKALVRDARILILDEPGAVLTPDERAELDRWLRHFADGGGTVVLITHKVREALAVADDLTVLRRGRTVLHSARADVTEDAVIDAMTGESDVGAAWRIARTESDRPTAGAAALRSGATGTPVLALDHVHVVDERGVTRLADVTLTIARGEVLGVIGVEGAGARELLRVLAGRLLPSQGTVTRPAHVGFIPEDRLHDAVVPTFSLTENLALAEAGAARGTLDWRALVARTVDVITAHDVRNGAPERRIDTLSGGNQQKFVVGREDRIGLDALVAENPTRGLDLRAAHAVLDIVRRTGGGDVPSRAVVFYSTDLDEVLSVATRVVACFNGTVREVRPAEDPADRTPYARALVGAS